MCTKPKSVPTFAKDCESIKQLGQPDGYYVIKNGTDFVVANCSSSEEDGEKTYSLVEVFLDAICTAKCSKFQIKVQVD